MRVLFLLPLLLVLLASPLVAAAQLDPGPDSSVVIRPEVLERVLSSLLVIEGAPPERFYAALGAEGRDALLSIVQSTRPVGLRRRAVLALAHYPDERVRAALVARAADPSEDAIVSRYALRSLGAAFAAVREIEAALADPRVLVREGAALALSAIDAEGARPALRRALETERDATVRRTLQTLLAE